MTRALPNFFLVGAPQAGTTSLYSYLDQHPAVFMSPIKEPCFFAPEVADITPHARALYDADAAALRRYIDGSMPEKRDHGLVLAWDDYLALFKNVRNETAIGEASVAYLASLGAASAIRARVPDARIVMMLRNPADRLFSRFLAARAAGDSAAFAEWLARRVADEKAGEKPSGPIWPGRYAVHLKRYLESFSVDRVHVCIYDDYVRTPARVVRDLLSFLGVDPDHPIDMTERHNVTLVPRWPAFHARLWPLVRGVRRLLPAAIAATVRGRYLTPRTAAPSAADRARALDVYRDDIRALETLLDRDLSAWLATS